MAAEGVDAYFGAKREHMRWLTGFTLAEGEDKVSGHSGQFLVGADSVIVLTDSRYTIQARREAPGAVVDEIGYDLPGAWPRLLASVGARRVAVEAAVDLARALGAAGGGGARTSSWSRSKAGSRPCAAIKQPDEIERIAAACAVADRALATLLPEIRPGVTERDLALRLEWLIRTGGAEALAFDVACLAGPEAALPHGSPGDRPVLANAVLLFDFGAQVDGYRSDMTRTLFVGEPTERDLAVYDLVARAQRRRSSGSRRGSPAGAVPPSRREPDAIARAVIDDGRPVARLRPRAGPRDRPRHPRGAPLGPHRERRSAAEPNGVLGRARDLPRGRDRRPDRGPRPRRCRRPPARRAA